MNRTEQDLLAELAKLIRIGGKLEVALAENERRKEKIHEALKRYEENRPDGKG